mgnify:CR=1 FL=1
MPVNTQHRKAQQQLAPHTLQHTQTRARVQPRTEASVVALATYQEAAHENTTTNNALSTNADPKHESEAPNEQEDVESRTVDGESGASGTEQHQKQGQYEPPLPSDAVCHQAKGNLPTHTSSNSRCGHHSFIEGAVWVLFLRRGCIRNTTPLALMSETWLADDTAVGIQHAHLKDQHHSVDDKQVVAVNTSGNFVITCHG